MYEIYYRRDLKSAKTNYRWDPYHKRYVKNYYRWDVKKIKSKLQNFGNGYVYITVD